METQAMSPFSVTIMCLHFSSAAVDFRGSVAKGLGVDAAARVPGLEAWLYYFLAVQLWTSHLISLCFSSLSYNKESEIVSVS